MLLGFRECSVALHRLHDTELKLFTMVQEWQATIPRSLAVWVMALLICCAAISGGLFADQGVAITNQN